MEACLSLTGNNSIQGLVAWTPVLQLLTGWAVAITEPIRVIVAIIVYLPCAG